MTKIMNWRLKTLPTIEEVRDLIKDKVITNEEARAMLFSEKEETENNRDIKSLESEIKFLRELVEKLARGNTKIVEVIKEVQKPYYYQGWYGPYNNWCYATLTGGSNTVGASSGTSNFISQGASGATLCASNSVNLAGGRGNASAEVEKPCFSSIKTF